MHEWIDLNATAAGASPGGVCWTLPDGFTDLNVNLVVLEAGASIGEHVNDEFDVLVIGVFGDGDAIVDGQTLYIAPGCLLAIARGSRREIRARDERLGYLTAHRRRDGITLRSAR